MSAADFISRVGDGLLQLAERPTSNLVAASLALAIVVIALLILIILALLTLTTGDGATTKRAGSLSRVDKLAIRRRKPHWRLTRRQVICIAAGLAIMAIVGTFVASSGNEYCASSCHSMVASAGTWEDSTHAKIRCVDCHESSVIDAAAKRARHAVAQVAMSGALDVRALVEAESCLRCHSWVLDDEAIERHGLKVVHSHFVERGIDCARCHTAVGHNDTQTVRAGAMSECLKCHNGDMASAECSTCHAGDVGLATVVDRTFGRVRLSPPTCEGCHQQDTCDKCHGLRMPHPANYRDARQHARDGAFEGRERLCYRCHTARDCGQCHSSLLTSGGHSPDWRTGHTQYTLADGRGYCRACHEPGDFCAVCHR
ncbi:MAG: hypothetical protein ACYC77_01925 [Coriobacteriia bacterium]